MEHEAGTSEDRAEKRRQRSRYLAKLREDQNLLLPSGDHFGDVAQTRPLAAVGFAPGAVAQPLRGMIANLFEAHQKRKNQPLAANPYGRVKLLSEIVHGLLGSPKEFTKFTKRLAERTHNPYGPLRELVRPYILRRLKTDRAVIADLPDKTEVKAFCQLSRKQAALYEQAVEALAGQLQTAEGIRRKGLVLSFLMRFKQICNHPSQWLGDGAWSEADSGKWARLRDIAEVIAARQEKVLVFTQFREVTAPLASFLGSIFGRPGLVLHGETAVKSRKELVRRFQEDEAVGFFVLSLKAGGTGLNLTAASHVIHFDRWWNPAVENQATDRAFRIGQKKNVLVHKFVCQGTVEEKIDQMIESKRQIAQDMLEGGVGVLLTEMKDDELLKMVALDLSAALKET